MHGNSLRIEGWWRLPAVLALALLGCLALTTSAVARPSSHANAAPAARPGVPCGPISFATPVTYYVGTRPRSATGGDFNRDGNPDVAVSDYSSRTVSILLGNADGIFQPSATYAVGFHPVSIAVGDFNEDTRDDLVVANYDSADVTILLGNADGTFQPGNSYPSNIGAYGVTAGDFNEDTHIDVATSNVNFGTINVMLGNGNGSVQAPVPYPAGLRPQVIAVGHFNADSHLDLVVPNYTASTVSVFLGIGDGTFQAAAARPVTPFADYVTVADMNHDGKDDLVLSHYATTDNIGVALGNGDGTFAPEVTYSTGGSDPTFAATGDFNGDGIPDLASPGYQSNTVSVLLGNGNGTFQPAVSFPATSGSYPVAVVPGDFNHDGRLDMLTANESTDNVSVFLSNCPLTTPTPTTPNPTLTPTMTPSPSTTPTPVAASATPTVTSTFTPPRTATSVASSTPPPVTGTPTNTSTPCAIGFSDVQPADYFYEPVRYLYCHRAISGYNDNTFRPFNNTTRGQLAKIVVLAQGWTIYTPPAPTFRDVPTTDAFYGYVETAYNHGIISGYACGAGCLEYRPGTNVTRGQLAKIVVLARAWTIYTPPSPTFTDVPATNAFYQYIETAYSHIIISGYSCGASCLEFRPSNNATRGQIAKIVYLAVTLP